MSNTTQQPADRLEELITRGFIRAMVSDASEEVSKRLYEKMQNVLEFQKKEFDKQLSQAHSQWISETRKRIESIRDGGLYISPDASENEKMTIQITRSKVFKDILSLPQLQELQ